ncbi:alpha-tocopherol transfer protein-like [Daphnia carinata]|uniref:alpha-tocopherol transfer protein-like n=1 Tax=Daphnia carinata TaxID=120202 RepID=UPI00257D599B|nr:alpha-tocopherol transfer protein-like [Daphnia carinata]
MNNNTEFKMHNSNELVTKFRSLIKESNISFQLSDELLICFLQARKCDLHRATKLLNNYLKTMKNYPELLTDLRLERVKHVLVGNHFMLSPLRDQHGHRLLIINALNWDISVCSLDDIFRTAVFCFQRIVCEPETQSNGVVIIIDFNGFTFHHFTHFTPSFLKKVADLVQDVFPIRLKGIHVLNEPRVVKFLVAMIWPFLTNKIRNRLVFHGSCFTTLHRHVNPSCLPSNYDGWLGTLDSMNFSRVLSEKGNANMFDCFI